MTEVYACLLGKWVNLTECDSIRIDNSYTDTYLWWEEQGPSLFKYDYINITVDNINYRIHPSFIQVVTK